MIGCFQELVLVLATQVVAVREPRHSAVFNRAIPVATVTDFVMYIKTVAQT